MKGQVQRIIFFVRPANDHPRHFQWQTADVCVFIADDDRERAFEKARQRVADERWEIISVTERSTLIEDRVRGAGGEVWKAYGQAREEGIYFRPFPRQPFAGDKDNPTVVLVPRLTEAFMDTVFERAGGRRLTEAEANHARSRNADYLLDDCIFELKILEEEGLEVRTRQEKLAELFRRPVPPHGTILLNPEELSQADRRKYMDVVGGPVKNAVKSASKQIRCTKEHLGRPDLRGGVIFLNTGYGTLPPELFATLVERYAAKDTSQVEVTAAVSTWFSAEGLGGTMMFEFRPHEPSRPVVKKLRDAFWGRVNEWMTEFARGGFPQGGRLISPLKPVSFEQGGIIFAAVPPTPAGENYF